MNLKSLQIAHLKQLIDAPHYKTLLFVLNEIDRQAIEAGTVGRSEYETVELAIRRDERRNVIREIIDTIEEESLKTPHL